MPRMTLCEKVCSSQLSSLHMKRAIVELPSARPGPFDPHPAAAEDVVPKHERHVVYRPEPSIDERGRSHRIVKRVVVHNQAGNVR